MRRRNTSPEDTRTRILDSAEELFGRRGVDAVSLREINAACGISQGVLHYHFGGREALVEAILDRHLPAINDARRRMVETLLADEKQPQLRDMVEVLVVPLAQLALKGGDVGMRFVRFLARLHQDSNDVYIDLVSSQFRDVRMGLLLERCFGQREAAWLEVQLGMAVDVLFSTLGTLDRPPRAWQTAQRSAPVDHERRVDWLVSFICKGLAGSEP